jgi:hypothetical protein
MTREGDAGQKETEDKEPEVHRQVDGTPDWMQRRNPQGGEGKKLSRGKFCNSYIIIDL